MVRITARMKRRYRLYVDESGGSAYRELDDPRKRYLGLTGIAVNTDYYRNTLCRNFEAMKTAQFPEHFENDPDAPLILHRTAIMQRSKSFFVLKSKARRQDFNQSLLSFLLEHRFGVFTVVIDKKEHLESAGPAANHPYNYCLAALLSSYCGYLDYYNCEGDVLVERRGKKEDGQLQGAYRDAFENGTLYHRPALFQRTLTTHELKIKPKEANLCGLQIADLLAHPSKIDVLHEQGIDHCPDGDFGEEVRKAIGEKYHRHPVTGAIRDHGRVFLK